MPKKSRTLPQNRSDWNFGDVLYWHLFENGTRPNGVPGRRGKLWDEEKAASACFRGVKTLWNWIEHTPPPVSVAPIEEVLFGDSAAYDDWRDELRQRHKQARSEWLAKQQPSAEQADAPDPSSDPSGQEQTVSDEPEATTEFEDAATPENEEIPPEEPEISGNNQKSPSISLPVVKGSTSLQHDDAPVSDKRKRVVGRIVAVAMITACGVYGWAKYRAGHITVASVETTTPPVSPTTPPPAKIDEPHAPEPPRPTAVPTAPNAPDPTAQQTAPPPPIQQPIPTESAPTPAPATRPTVYLFPPSPFPAPTPDAREVAAREAAAKAEVERQKRLQAERDVIERRNRETEAADREANERLRMGAAAETDSCARKLEGISAPGFALKCDTILTGGTTLGSNQLSYDVTSLQACAAKCRPISRCVGFSLNMERPAGIFGCVLYGPTPGSMRARNYISGTR